MSNCDCDDCKARRASTSTARAPAFDPLPIPGWGTDAEGHVHKWPEDPRLGAPAVSAAVEPTLRIGDWVTTPGGKAGRVSEPIHVDFSDGGYGSYLASELTRQSTLGETVAAAQREVASWGRERKSRAQLEGVGSTAPALALDGEPEKQIHVHQTESNSPAVQRAVDGDRA